MLEKDTEELKKILEELQLNTKADDNKGIKKIKALERVIEELERLTKDIWISSNIDLMIALDNQQLRVFEKGKELRNIKNIEFKKNIEEVSVINITQII